VVDADDQAVRGALAAMADRLDAVPAAAVVAGDYEEFGTQDLLRAVPDVLDPFRVAYCNEYPVTAMFRRSVLEQVGGWRTELRGYEDWDLWMTLAERGLRMEHLGHGRPIYRRRLHGTRMLTGARGRHVELYGNLRSAHPRLFAELGQHRRRSSMPWRRKLLYPVVYGGRPVKLRDDDYYVDVDNVRGGREATEYLIGRGHKRIATITGPLTMRAAMERLTGWRDALTGAGLPLGAVEDGNFTDDGGAEAMRRILASGEKPDAVFAASDLMARGALHALASAGLRVPEDVAVIGFDDSPIATSVTPSLTTMRQPSFLQGEEMASMLIDRLAGIPTPHSRIMPTGLVVRESA